VQCCYLDDTYPFSILQEGSTSELTGYVSA
jgi:hypothetical protein